MAAKEPQQPQPPQNKPKPPAPPPKKRDDDEDEPERRGFLIKAGAVVVGGIVTAVPVASGMYTLADPLRKKQDSALPGPDAAQAGDDKFIPVAYVNEIPTNGMPKRFTVQKDARDAWNVYPKEPVGAVYLRLVPGQPLPTAVTATCPHLGCSVVFDAKESHFQCPCHDSKFESDGKRIDPEHCPSARDLDSLNVEVRPDAKGDIVYVEFQKFKGGSEKKIVKE